jgi:hypothetical protein
MSSTTRVGVAQDALVALLRAASSLSGVTVDLGPPVGTLKAEQLWISGDIKNWQDTPDVTTTSVASVREETFTIPVNIIVLQSTNTYKTVRDRALVLTAAVEGVIALNPTLSGTIMQASIASKELTDGAADQQRQVVVTLRVDCLAMLA